MLSEKIYRLTVLVLAASLCISTAYFAFALVGAWAENEQLLQSESALVRQIDVLSRERQYKEEYYYRLLHDKDFKERVIREKLGYVGKRELVFRFDDSANSPDDENTKVSATAEPSGSVHSETPPAKPEGETPPRETSLRRESIVISDPVENAKPVRKISSDRAAPAGAQRMDPDIERAIRISEGNRAPSNAAGANSGKAAGTIKFRTVGTEGNR